MNKACQSFCGPQRVGNTHKWVKIGLGRRGATCCGGTEESGRSRHVRLCRGHPVYMWAVAGSETESQVSVAAEGKVHGKGPKA